MSKSIYATIQESTEKIIREEENKHKEEFLNFLNGQLGEILQNKSYYFWRGERTFSVPREDSTTEFKNSAEKMGFECQCEYDSYYGDKITLIPKAGEALKFVEAFNKKAEAERKAEQRRKDKIRKESIKVARVVAKDVLGRLKAKEYEMRKYNDKICTIKVKYEPVSLEGIDLDIFISGVQDILSKYKFPRSSFGGTINSYFNIDIERKAVQS